MNVERQMRAVERDVVFECEFQLPPQCVCHWAQSRPEQTVMHDQKIDIFICGFGQDARRDIHRRANFRRAAGVFDLQTVQRIVPIADFANAQVVVGVLNNFRQSRHR